MSDYALHRMRIRQENKIAAASSSIDPERALAFYKQALDLNTRFVAELVLRQDSTRLSPSMQHYYFERLAELASSGNT